MLERQTSQASDTSRTSDVSGFSDQQTRVRTDEDKQQQDVLESAPAVQTAMFELLYMVQKVRVDVNPYVALLKLTLDFLQLILLLLQPQFRWNIDTSAWIWKAVNWIAFFPSQITLKSYELYTGVVIFVAAVIVSGVLVCFWALWCFRNGVIPMSWGIGYLRCYMLVVIKTYYVAVLSLFLVGLNCRAVGSIPHDQAHGTLGAYPDIACASSPGLAYLVVSTLMVLVMMLLSTGMALSESERNPASGRLLAMSGAACEVRALMAKTAIAVVAGTLHGYKKPQSVLIVCITLFLVWTYYKRMPHLIQWINHIRTGLYSMVALTGGLQVAMAFDRRVSLAVTVTRWLWIMLAPTFCLGFLLSWLHTWMLRRKIRHAFRVLGPEEKAKTYYFEDVAEVEFGMRCLRRWLPDERDTLDPAAIKEAEAILKVGLSQFPTTAQMTLMNSNFLISVTENYHSGFSQTQAAKKQSPSAVDVFTIFVREQEHLSASATHKGAGGAVDLASYVEFQRSHRMALQSHKLALLAVRQFWRAVLHPVVSFRHVSGLVKGATTARGVAEKTYRSVLERYPKSSKLVRGYAHFLEHVHNDPWAAARFYRQAEKLDEESHAAQSTMLQMASSGDGAPVDEKNSAIIIFSATGVIQMVNKVTADMFGWRKSDLESKNVAVLVPPPYNLVVYIKGFSDTETSRRAVQMVGQHFDKYVFGIDLFVSKVSGTGDEATFMAVMKPVPAEVNVVKVWALPGGGVCHVDAQFQDSFGVRSLEQIGQSIAGMAVDPAVLSQLEATAMASMATADEKQVLAAAVGVRMVHKYRDPVEMDVSVSVGGPEMSRVLVFSFLRKEAADMLMVTDHRGRITHMTASLATLLGHSAPSLVEAGTPVGTLLPQPWAQLLFPQWLKDATLSGGRGGVGQGGADGGGGGGNARGGQVVQLLASNKQLVTARLHVTSVEEGEQTALVITVHKTTVEAGLDLRRLRVQVDSAGVVLSVGDSPPWLFGFPPSALVGNNIRSFIDVMHKTKVLHANPTPAALTAKSMDQERLDSLDVNALPPAAGGAFSALSMHAFTTQPDPGTSTEQVLLRLAELTIDSPGTSWRVGIHPAAEESSLSNMSSLAQGMLAKQTRPAVMQITVVDSFAGGVQDTLGASAAPVAVMTLHLWRADALCGVVEVDVKKGTVTKAVDQVINPTGLIWGKPQQAFLGRPLSDLVEASGLGGVTKLMSLDDASRRGGGIKAAKAAAGKVGPLRQATSHHVDGTALQLSVQAIGKQGQDSRTVLLVLRLATPKRGDAAAFLTQLFTVPSVRSLEPMETMASTRLGRPTGPGGAQLSLFAMPSGNPRGFWENLPRAATGLGELPMPLLPAPPSAPAAVKFAVPGTPEPTAAPPAVAFVNDSAAQTAEVCGAAGEKPPSRAASAAKTRPGSPKALAAPAALPAAADEGEAEASSGPAAREGEVQPCDDSAQLMPAEEEDGSETDQAEMRRSKSRVEEWVSRAPSPECDGGPLGRAVRSMEAAAAHPAPAGEHFLSLNHLESGLHKRAGGGGGGNGANDHRTPRSNASSDDDHGPAAHGNYAASDAGSDAQSRHSDADIALDFRRGKRFHKLIRLLSSGAAQLASVRIKWHTIVLWFVRLVVFTACFVSLEVAISNQIKFSNDTLAASMGTQAMLRISFASRCIANIHNDVYNTIYDKAALAPIAGLLAGALSQFRVVHSGIYLGFGATQKHLPTAYNLKATWDDSLRPVRVKYDTEPPSYAVVPTGLWVEGNSYIAAGNEILQNHNLWAAENISVSSRSEFYFLIQNGGPDLFEGYKTTLDGFSRRAADSSKTVSHLQIIFIVVQGCVVCLLATIYASWLLHRVAEQRYRLFSVFLAVPQGFVRTLATKQVRLDDDSEDDSDEEAEAEAATAAGAAAGTAAAGSVAVTIGGAERAMGEGEGPQAPPKQRMHAVWAALKHWIVFWSPLQVAGGKRKLLRDDIDTYWLITPYLLYIAAIVATYIAGYSILGNMLEPIQGLNLINTVRTRMLRVFFWAHEAASLNGVDAAGFSYAMAMLVADTTILAQSYQAMQFGVRAIPSLRNDPLYDHMNEGIPFYSQAASNIFFKTGQCLVTPASACKQPGSPYYTVSQSGLDAMMERFILEAVNLGKDNISAINLNNTRLAYISAMGPNDIYAGMVAEAQLALGNVVSYYTTVKTATMAVFIGAWIYAAIYLVFFMRTHLWIVAREARQVADMLSQLPKDVDVELLVRKMLLQTAPATGDKPAGGENLSLEQRPLLGTSDVAQQHSFLSLNSPKRDVPGRDTGVSMDGPASLSRRRFNNKVSPLLDSDLSL